MGTTPKGIELIPVDSTSAAADRASEDINSAAICSHIAAKLINLPVLFENIEDSSDNQTRFLILAKNFENEESGKDKTTLLVRLPHEPGSLAEFLMKFHKANINLTKIESRPAKIGRKFSYIFYIEFDGHFKDKKVQKVIKSFGKGIKWLGSYVKMV
jgi:chorismate mutase/prephenate dehydratase